MSAVAVILRVAAAVVLTVSITPAASAQDTTPPELLDFGFSPSTVDVTSASQDVTFTLHATDDIAGVSFVSVPVVRSSLETQVGVQHPRSLRAADTR